MHTTAVREPSPPPAFRRLVPDAWTSITLFLPPDDVIALGSATRDLRRVALGNGVWEWLLRRDFAPAVIAAAEKELGWLRPGGLPAARSEREFFAAYFRLARTVEPGTEQLTAEDVERVRRLDGLWRLPRADWRPLTQASIVGHLVGSGHDRRPAIAQDVGSTESVYIALRDASRAVLPAEIDKAWPQNRAQRWRLAKQLVRRQRLAAAEASNDGETPDGEAPTPSASAIGGASIASAASFASNRDDAGDGEADDAARRVRDARLWDWVLYRWDANYAFYAAAEYAADYARETAGMVAAAAKWLALPCAIAERAGTGIPALDTCALAVATAIRLVRCGVVRAASAAVPAPLRVFDDAALPPIIGATSGDGDGKGPVVATATATAAAAMNCTSNALDALRGSHDARAATVAALNPAGMVRAVAEAVRHVTERLTGVAVPLPPTWLCAASAAVAVSGYAVVDGARTGRQQPRAEALQARPFVPSLLVALSNAAQTSVVAWAVFHPDLVPFVGNSAVAAYRTAMAALLPLAVVGGLFTLVRRRSHTSLSVSAALTFVAARAAEHVFEPLAGTGASLLAPWIFRSLLGIDGGRVDGYLVLGLLCASRFRGVNGRQLYFPYPDPEPDERLRGSYTGDMLVTQLEFGRRRTPPANAAWHPVVATAVALWYLAATAPSDAPLGRPEVGATLVHGGVSFALAMLRHAGTLVGDAAGAKPPEEEPSAPAEPSSTPPTVPTATALET